MTRASLIALALLITPAFAGDTITLHARPGGYALHHVRVADVWLRQGKRVVIAGDQASAAAIQVIYYAGRGGSICAMRGVLLYLHEGRSRGAVTNANRRYLGRTLATGWYAPEKFGIGECT